MLDVAAIDALAHAEKIHVHMPRAPHPGFTRTDRCPVERAWIEIRPGEGNGIEGAISTRFA
jgi:hypothetical protein